MNGKWAFLIMGAGQGKRLGGVPKQFRILGGEPLWRWSLRLARGLGVPSVLTVPKGQGSMVGPGSDGLKVIEGGETRSMSVRRALENTDADFVLIHDGARPFGSLDLCRRVMDKVTKDKGVIPALPLSDAVKKISKDGKAENLDREDLVAVQTPQGFHRESLMEALKDYPPSAKDESEAWIASGRDLVTVPGEKGNFKITTKEDWDRASMMVSCRETRRGLGYDIHPLVPRRPLILGGVRIPSPLGLEGHSDSDLICHALSDGILGACGLPDIGILFPASDEAYLGADSFDLLKKVIAMAENDRWDVLWADIVLNAQIPRMGAFVADIEKNLERAWDDGKRRINLKVKSGEGIGSVGKGRCMTCYALVEVGKSVQVGI